MQDAQTGPTNGGCRTCLFAVPFPKTVTVKGLARTWHDSTATHADGRLEAVP